MPELSIAQANAALTAPSTMFELETRTIRGIETRCWKNIPKTLRELLAIMRLYDERVYLVYEDERSTYREVFSQVAALATHLHGELGIRKGDRVAIAMRNVPEWPIAFWAAASIGAVIVPLNAWWKDAELRYGLVDSGARVLICDDERARLLAGNLEGCSVEHTLVARVAPANGALPSGMRDLREVLAKASNDSTLPDVSVDPEDDATIFYTSGTTGKPKGAIGTHRNLTSNIGSALFVRARAMLRRGESLPAPGSVVPQTAILLSVPYFHVTGCHSVLAAGSFSGTKLVMMHRWNPERALELIERERISQFGGVPSMVWQVLESPDFEKRDTSSVLSVGYGGAPAAPELVRRIRASFPTSSASNGYGLTETSAISTMNAGVDYERKPDSVGPPVPICEVKVVDAAGNTLPVGSVGELCIKGANVVRGYFGKAEATAQSFREGYLHTGDIARVDEEGFVYILDRAKDMLIRGGENVYCVEVEDVLYSHPEVMDAAVLGIPHRVLGEEVGAVVQLTAASKISASDLQAYARERLAGFKVPVRIELRTDPLPRNENGKILKRQLKQDLGWV